MRIISGTYRGLQLADVGKGDAAAHLRPTADRVREALFNLLQNGGYGSPVQDARVLDLFAGTGALGLEALSRGAAHVGFVDNGPVARALLRDNIKRCNAGAATRVHSIDATQLGPCAGEAFSLIFMDPPYGTSLGGQALLSAKSNGWLATSALIVWEDNTPPLLPAGFEMLDQRRYGDTVITILRAA